LPCFAALLALLCVGCGKWLYTGVAVGATAATPTFTPPGGSYTTSQQITIADATPGASLYYTTDGTAPTVASMPYSGAISVSSNETINAIAVASGYNNSAIGSAAYIFTPEPTAATPTFAPSSGSYTIAQQVTIADATPSAVIYYTTNGMAPTIASTLYTGAVSVSSNETINAIAVATGYINSAVGSATYTFTSPVATGDWTWMSGSSADLASGTYGTQGVASAGNTPGARSENDTWADMNGNLWLFGGVGYDSVGATNYLNDFWSYNIAAGEWAWVGGSSTANAYGVYGTLGVASPNNVPGARIAGGTWVDLSGNLWLFGGEGADSSEDWGAMNDLWMFDPSTSMWTWEGGQNALNPRGIYGTRGVPSASNLPGGRENEMNWTDSAGNFWLFGGDGIDANGTWSELNDLWMFNPTTKEWTWVSGSITANAVGVYGTQGVASPSNVPGARSLGVGWADTQGNFWIFGGTNNNAFNVLDDLWMFSPSTGQWTWVNGSSTVNTPAIYGTQNVPDAGNTPGGRSGGMGLSDSSGNLYFFGGYGYSPTDPRFSAGSFNDLWKFDSTSKMWTWISGSDAPEAPGVYGTKGVSAPGNVPGSRYPASGWIDNSGDVWLFGSDSRLSTGNGDTNDLWRYVP